MGNNKKLKLEPIGYVTPYSPGNGSWAFAKKVGDTYTVLTSALSCKDYIHEGIANKVHNKDVCPGGATYKKDINIENFQIVMYFMKHTLKQNILFIKRYVNTIEKRYNITQTSIIEAESNFNDRQAYVITASDTYIKSPVLYHTLVAMLRTIAPIETKVTRENLEDLLLSLNGCYDSDILSFVVKHSLYNLLIKEHATIVKDLALTNIYPKEVDNIIDGDKVASYHGGFGIVALCRRKLASKAYSKNILAVLKKAEIPLFN